MKAVFDESRVSNKADPLDSKQVGFDWEELYRLLGESSSSNSLSGDEQQRLATAIGELLRWVIGDPQGPRWHHAVARRAVALGWATSPAYFSGSPSLAGLAKRLKVPPDSLSRLTGAASRRFDVRNRAQVRHRPHGKGRK